MELEKQQTLILCLQQRAAQERFQRALKTQHLDRMRQRQQQQQQRKKQNPTVSATLSSDEAGGGSDSSPYSSPAGSPFVSRRTKTTTAEGRKSYSSSSDDAEAEDIILQSINVLAEETNLSAEDDQLEHFYRLQASRVVQVTLQTIVQGLCNIFLYNYVQADSDSLALENNSKGVGGITFKALQAFFEEVFTIPAVDTPSSSSSASSSSRLSMDKYKELFLQYQDLDEYIDRARVKQLLTRLTAMKLIDTQAPQLITQHLNR
jgi:hypothetical protein